MTATYYTALGHTEGHTKQYTHDFPVYAIHVEHAVRYGGMAISQFDCTTFEGIRYCSAILNGNGFVPVEIIASKRV